MPHHGDFAVGVAVDEILQVAVVLVVAVDAGYRAQETMAA